MVKIVHRNSLSDFRDSERVEKEYFNFTNYYSNPFSLAEVK